MDRATGKTTRLIDAYIQDGFSSIGEWILIEDHSQKTSSASHLLEKLTRRAKSEHSGSIIVEKKLENGCLFFRFVKTGISTPIGKEQIYRIKQKKH